MINILVFAITMPWGNNFTQLWLDGALFPAAVTQGFWLHGLVTHMFLHAGFMHLAGNMLFLWVFGDNLEDQFGHVGFALFYLLGGLAAAAAQIVADPISEVPMVGASGAIAAVMGGYLLLFPSARVDVLFIFIIFFRIFTIPAVIVLGAWFGLQLVSEMMSGGAGDGVAYLAHIGGFAAGAVLALPFWLRRGGPRFWQRTQGHPPHPAGVFSRTTIPIVRRR